MILAGWLAASWAGPLPLPKVVAVRIPAPIAALDEDEEAHLCVSLSPSIDTPHTELDEGDFSAYCVSDGARTQACLVIRPGARWKGRYPDLVCRGDVHQLHATYVPGYDPFDDPSDGLTIARLRGPTGLVATLHATFAAPGWPDAVGILEGGACAVKDERLTVKIVQRSGPRRVVCTLVMPQGADRVVPIRFVGTLRP